MCVLLCLLQFVRRGLEQSTSAGVNAALAEPRGRESEASGLQLFSVKQVSAAAGGYPVDTAAL